MELKDFTGRIIERGRTIIYPVRRRNAMWLKRIRVEQIIESPIRVKGQDTDYQLHGYDPDSASRRQLIVKHVANCVIDPTR